MNRPYAVFIGDVALDEFFRTSHWPTSPGTKIDLVPAGTHVGGMIANAAAVYAALGEDAWLLWSMNDSGLSEQLLDELNRSGVDTRLVTRNPALADSRNIIVLVDGEHTVMTPALGLETIPVDDAALSVLSRAQYVYTAIGDMRSLRHDAAGPDAVLTAVRSGGAKIVLDLDVANLRDGDDQLIAGTDILIVNHRGFETYRAGRPADEVFAALLARGTAIVVVTLAGDGCRVVDAERDVMVPGIAVEAVDVTGAGDTFGAAFLHALNLTGDSVEAARFANAAAARAVTRVGARAGAVSHAEVLAFLASHGLEPPNLTHNPLKEGQYR